MRRVSEASRKGGCGSEVRGSTQALSISVVGLTCVGSSSAADRLDCRRAKPASPETLCLPRKCAIETIHISQSGILVLEFRCQHPGTSARVRDLDLDALEPGPIGFRVDPIRARLSYSSLPVRVQLRLVHLCSLPDCDPYAPVVNRRLGCQCGEPHRARHDAAPPAQRYRHCPQCVAAARQKLKKRCQMVRANA